MLYGNYEIYEEVSVTTSWNFNKTIPKYCTASFNCLTKEEEITEKEKYETDVSHCYIKEVHISKYTFL
jgi:hypothetical protein